MLIPYTAEIVPKNICPIKLSAPIADTKQIFAQNAERTIGTTPKDVCRVELIWWQTAKRPQKLVPIVAHPLPRGRHFAEIAGQKWEQPMKIAVRDVAPYCNRVPNSAPYAVNEDKLNTLIP